MCIIAAWTLEITLRDYVLYLIEIIIFKFLKSNRSSITYIYIKHKMYL